MQLQAKGYLSSGDGCGDGCGPKTAAQPFSLVFRNGFETYAECRSGEFSVATLPGAWVDLPLTEQLDTIELLALRTSGPIKLRVNGLPATTSTAAVYPVASLSGLSLTFGVDGYPVTAVFEAGDDTASDVARRVNSAAALAGVPFIPAEVGAVGQVVIHGQASGAQGFLSAFTGSSVAALGLSSWLGGTGKGSDVDVDGLQVLQFGRVANVVRVEVSGQATVSVLVAGT